MFEAAQIVRTSPREGAVVIASRTLVDAGRPALQMLSVARALATLGPWCEGVVDPSATSAHWLVLSALDRAAPAVALEGLAREAAGLRLLVDAPAGFAPAEGLEAGLARGVVPLPFVAVRLYDLAGFVPGEDPAGPPIGVRLAADWIASGRSVALVTADGAGLAGAEALEGACAALRHLAGHVPLAVLRRIGALAGEGGLGALRRRHARLNGDVFDAIRADPAAAAAFREAGCALARPVRKAAGDTRDAAPGAGWGEEAFETDLARYFGERAWLGAQIAAARRTFASMAAMRTRQTCVIVGNGASLAEADPALFEAHDVIASNFALHSPLLRRHAKILTVTNGLVAEQGAAAFNASPIPVKVAPIWLAHVLHEDAGFVFVNATGETGFHADDPAGRISWSSTVSFFNMQLAYALGYRRALLVGFDHSYVQPKESRLGEVLEQSEDDPNHFDPLYFRKRRWQAADTTAMEACYSLARAAYEADGRDILNLSPSSRLTLFDRHPPDAPLPPLPEPATGAGGGVAGAGAPSFAAARAAAVSSTADGRLAFSSSKISERLDSGNYRHIVCAVSDVKAGPRVWTAIYFKIQRFNEESYLELRQSDFRPAGFTPWPIPDEDTWGPYLRVPLEAPERAARTLERFRAGLAPSDQEAFHRLVAAIPHLVRTATPDDEDGAVWHEGVTRLEAALAVVE